jgi:flagellar basal body-associated protein FliL
MAEETRAKGDAGAGAERGASAADKKGAGKAAAGGGGGSSISGGMLTKTPVLLGGAMIIEAVVLFAGFKFLSGGMPQSAAGAELTTEDHGRGPGSDSGVGASGDHGAGGASGGENSHGSTGSGSAKIDRKRSIEVQILDFRAPNKQSGRTFLYDVTIFAVTKSEFEERVKATIKEREALIKDRVRTIIAQSDPEKLGGGSEPGLETLRRQVKYQLDEIVGEGVIDEVLVPRCIPFRTDY